MVKVITYGTFDLLHYGHIRFLQRAKDLGDYLIVGVTAEDFDKNRGKINVQQPLSERVENVRATGLADEIIIEEYEGQKIDDILRYGVDIFTVGSDWEGKFDYLREYCKVIYLPRTQGISSTELRSENSNLTIGFVGDQKLTEKYRRECAYVNGAQAVGDMAPDTDSDEFPQILEKCQALYIATPPEHHVEDIWKALKAGKHVLCESPIALSRREYLTIAAFAAERNLVLMDAIKTAYATAYRRLLLLIKSGKIGKVVSVDATCTSLRDLQDSGYQTAGIPNSICSWGPTALLPIFQLLGTDYRDMRIVSFPYQNGNWDAYTKIDFIYDNAVASARVGKGAKAEGELIVTGTKGYAYVPAPWWKTDYFEVRYEDQTVNKRYYYQLDGEGIRYEILSFVWAARSGKSTSNITGKTTGAICKVLEDYYSGTGKETIPLILPPEQGGEKRGDSVR